MSSYNELLKPMKQTATANRPDIVMRVDIVIDVQNETQVKSAPGRSRVEECIRTTIDAANGSHAAACELAVRFVDEDEGRALNRQYRQQDKATNVLSFPVDPPAGLPVDQIAPLGDIGICGPVVEREAADQGKDAADHWSHMLVHGTLHLLGFDHTDSDDAEKMEQLETDILAACGIDNPYG
jgi:probable rRNA maturation factor